MSMSTDTDTDIDTDDRVESTKEAGRYLPPIYRLKMPHTLTQSATIRWLAELGYPVKVISKALDIRYQQVRNIITTKPKRAAREDLPPLEIELQDLEDAVDTLLGEELERTFKEDAAATKAQKRRARRGEAADDEYTEEDDHDA